MIYKLLFSLFLFFSVINISFGGEMQNVNLKWKNYGLKQYRILVQKVENGEYVEVLDKVVTTNRYIFTNDQSGFFFLKVYAVPSNKLLTTRPLYWATPGEVFEDEDKMLCGKKMEFKWHLNSIDSKYLFRLVEKQTGRVAFSKVTRDDHVVVPVENMQAESNYQAFVVSYDEAGHVEVILDNSFLAIPCKAKPLPETPFLDKTQLGIAYLPAYGKFEDELSNTIEYHVASYLNGRIFYESPTITRHNIKVGGTLNYNIYDSPFDFTHVDFDGVVYVSKVLKPKWIGNVRMRLMNISTLKPYAYLQDFSEVEKRSTFWAIGCGATYRDYIYRLKTDLFFNIEVLPTGATGYEVSGGARFYFNSHWWWTAEAEYMSVSDDYDLTRALIKTGPVYNF